MLVCDVYGYYYLIFLVPGNHQEQDKINNIGNFRNINQTSRKNYKRTH